MALIPEAVLWSSVAIFAVLFILANQQLYVAPGWQSKDVLRLRMGITFALFLELLLPSLELLVRYVPEMSSFIHMIPTLVFWMLLLVLSYALHKSIRVSREQDDKKWAIHLHRVWVMMSMLNVFCWSIGILFCFAAFILFPVYVVLVVNLYYIFFNLYIICAAINTLLIAYRISISLKRMPSMTRSSNSSSDPVPTLASNTRSMMAKRIVRASVLLWIVLSLLALCTIYSVSATVMIAGPFGKMDTLSFHVVFTLSFSLSLLYHHWYTPQPFTPDRRDTAWTDNDTQKATGTANGNRSTMTHTVTPVFNPKSSTLPPISPNGTKHFPEITPMDSFNINLPKMSEAWSERSDKT